MCAFRDLFYTVDIHWLVKVHPRNYSKAVVLLWFGSHFIIIGVNVICIIIHMYVNDFGYPLAKGYSSPLYTVYLYI